MAWFSGADKDGRPALVNTSTGEIRYLNPDGSPLPVGVLPPQPGDPPPPPGEPGKCVADEAFVVAMYHRYLGRDPEDRGAIDGRVGLPCDVVESGIANSDEAAQYAAAHGLPPPPHTGSPTPKVVPPKAKPAPAVGDSATSILLGIASTIADLLAHFGTIKDDIGQRVADAIQKAAPIIARTVADVTAKLGEAVTQLVPSTLNLIGSALGGVESVVSSFLANAADVGDVADAFTKAIKDHEGGMLEFVVKAISGPGAALIEHIALGIHTGEINGEDALIVAAGMSSKAIAAAYQLVADRGSQA